MRLYTDASTDPYTWMCPFVCTNPHLDMCDAAQLPGQYTVVDLLLTIMMMWGKNIH